jgi:hypothetical protein
MPIFSVLDSSLSPIFVWTQLLTTEPSVSAVLALLVAAPAAAPAAVELLLPMAAARSKSFAGMEVGRKASLEQNAREKMTAAEWDEQLPLCCNFYLVPGNRWLILAIHCEGEAAGRIWPSTCQHHGRRGLHYAR